MIKDITHVQSKEYVSNPCKCPNCHKEPLSAESFNEDSKGRVILCTNCGFKFWEVWKMISIEIFNSK